MHQKLSCACGKNTAYLFHRDDILPEEVVASLHCPECRGRADWDKTAMIEDTGWIIEYDMDVACFYFQISGMNRSVTPEFLFDEDYCSWYGMSPADMDENARVHQELLPLQKKDKLLYFKTLKEKRLAHFKMLKQAGWRKAQNI